MFLLNNSDKVKITCDGDLCEKFINFSLEKSIENFCGSFSFTITQSTANRLGVRQGSRIVIDIADETVFTGLVEAIEHNQGFNQHSITISGRDKTAELIDSYILPKQYKQNDFIKLMRIVLDDNGYKNIRIESDIRTLPKLLGNSFVAEKDQKIFDFFDKLARLLNVILITDAYGDILITREGADLAVGGVNLTSGGINALSSSLSVDSNETYKYIRIIGSQKTDNSKKRLKQKVEFTDERASTKKRLIVSIGNNANRQTLESVANWYMAVKRGKGARYNTEVQGFLTNITSGILWQPNTILLLKDQANNINGSFLIQGVNYSQDSSGSKTSLSVCNIGSFSSFNDNPLLSPQVAKFFKTFNGDLADKYR
jgi:prophage tail gpP-like protein